MSGKNVFSNLEEKKGKFNITFLELFNSAEQSL